MIMIQLFCKEIKSTDSTQQPNLQFSKCIQVKVFHVWKMKIFHGNNNMAITDFY